MIAASALSAVVGARIVPGGEAGAAAGAAGAGAAAGAGTGDGAAGAGAGAAEGAAGAALSGACVPEAHATTSRVTNSKPARKNTRPRTVDGRIFTLLNHVRPIVLVLSRTVNIVMPFTHARR
ncbi:MAG: hypothetical protein FJ315_01700 [SAR202 cluster bacterium]|nr:hypothetical protein [SAR202 cluster bacterium]